MVIKLQGGIENDAIEWKRIFRFRAGVRKYVKSKINKRERKRAKREIEQYEKNQI